MKIQLDWTHTIVDVEIKSWEIERTGNLAQTSILLDVIPFTGGISARYFDEHPLPGRNFYRVRGKLEDAFTEWSAFVGPPLEGKIVEIIATQIEE